MKINTHTHIHTHLFRFVDNTHFQFEKQINTVYLNQGSIISFKGRSSYESSLIFIKSFKYLINLPLLIALICFLKHFFVILC